MTAVIDNGIPDSLPIMPNSATLPRFITPIHPRRAFSWGESARVFAETLPIHAGRVREWRYWQRLVMDRALECDSDGNLLWPTVVISAPRQSGKSVIERIACLWRIHQSQLFGETQTVLHVAHAERTAKEIWTPAAMWVQHMHGKRALRVGTGQTAMTLPDGSRWLVQAATIGAGVGFSLSMVLVDEAWNIHRNIVEAALAPTMLESKSPQLWLVSTAGTAESDLMRAYRNYALAGDANVLLIEWSAPEELEDIHDRDAWRLASPYWDERREQRMAEKVETVEEWAFRQQYLNQWVPQLASPLISASLIDEIVTHEPLPDGETTFGVDVSADRTHAAIVAHCGGRCEVVDSSEGTQWLLPRLVGLAERWNPPAIGFDAGGPAQWIADQLKLTEHGPLVQEFNGREMAAASAYVYDALAVRQLTMRSHPALINAMSVARKRPFGQSWIFARAAEGGATCVPLLAAVLSVGCAQRAATEVEASAIW
jgi:hypothetical protein